MKKLITIFIFFLIVTLMAGCANDQYAIEKQYWQAFRQVRKIHKNPDASPPNELERVVGLLSRLIEKYPQANLSIKAEFNIAQLYLVKKEYHRARAYLAQMLEKHSESAEICSEVLFFMGNSYELEDKWDLALAQYKKLIQQYPITLRGLDIPVYTAMHYKVKYQPDKMVAAFQEAISHYKSLGAKYPNTALAFKADELVTQCYVALKDWQNAVNNYHLLIERYKDKMNMDGALMDVALIYTRELKDIAKAKETLERLIKEYPRSRLLNSATVLLKELGKK